MSNDLVMYEGAGALSQWREPEEVLKQAQKAAVALKGVMEKKENKVMFNNEQYLEREDWGTVAAFFGCTAKSISTSFVDFGEAGRGFEAVALVVDGAGREIGRAESMCLDTEENWGDVPKYIWKDVLDENGNKIWDKNLRNGKGGYKATKVQDGSSKKPLFQLRSMAQTRAEAKALKGVFSWVVVLAGYRPTPAEELTGHEDFDRGGQPQGKPPVTQPQRASEKKQPEGDTKTSAQAGSAQQTTTGSQTGSSAEHEANREISGIIEGAKIAKSGSMWLTVKGESLVIAVDPKDIDADMKEGWFIKFRSILKKTDKFKSEQNPNGHFLALTGLIELSEVKEGEVVQQEEQAEPQGDPAVIDGMAEDLWGKSDKQGPAGQAAVQNLVDSGQLKKASDLPAAKKTGTIGTKRAQRLYTLINTNKANNNGFNEAELKKIMSGLPSPIEHLSDLEVGMYEEFEKLATGEKDWRKFWDEE